MIPVRCSTHWWHENIGGQGVEALPKGYNIVVPWKLWHHDFGVSSRSKAPFNLIVNIGYMHPYTVNHPSLIFVAVWHETD